MGLFKNWLGSSYTMQLLIIRFIGLLGWLSCFAIASGEGQAAEAVTGAVQNFPNVGITCIGNLAILITSLLRGRLDLDMAARDVLATRRGPKLQPIHRFGLKTCEKYKDASVVLLSFHSPNSSIKQYMRYISSAHNVQSILLECLPLRSAALLAEICHCNDECKCIVFCTVEAVNILLARRISGTLKRVTDTLCVLLSRDCLKKGCHGCNQGLLYVKFDKSEGATDESKGATDESKRVRLIEDEKEIDERKWSKLIEGEENEIDEIEGLRLEEGKRRKLTELDLDRLLEELKRSTLTDPDLDRLFDILEEGKRSTLTELDLDRLLDKLLDRLLDRLEEGKRSTPTQPDLDRLFDKLEEGKRSPLKEFLLNKLLDRLLDRYSVLETLDHIYERPIQAEGTCICIPLRPAEDDKWTDLMMRSLRSKDKDGRGVRVMASDALENYMALGAQENYMSTEIVGAKGIEVTYSNGSLIVPRVIEMFLNLAMTGWFRTDGFSTSMLARRSIRDYLVDSRGNGFAINAFVTYARVKSSQVRSANIETEHRDVCQVLTFRGNFLRLGTLSIIGACVNLICSFGWTLLVAIEGGVVVKWQYTPSMPLSETRVAIIMAGIVTGLGMDCLHLYLGRPYPLDRRETVSRETVSKNPVPFIIVCAMIVLETICIALCSTIARFWGIKGFGRWIYSALQILVWVKWAAGSYLLGERLSNSDSGPIMTTVYKEKPDKSKEKLDESKEKLHKEKPDKSKEKLDKSKEKLHKWTDNGILVYSSAFLLNAFLAGVRGKWKYISKEN